MTIQDNPKLEECLKIAREAQNMRNEAQKLLKQAKSVEENAVEAFRNLREEVLKGLQEDREKLTAEAHTLDAEYLELLSTFCTQVFNALTYEISLYSDPKKTTRMSRYIRKEDPLYFLKDLLLRMRGYRDPHKREAFLRMEEQERESIIHQAVEQTEDLELQKTAQSILKHLEKSNNINNKLAENRKSFEEICTLFGHDADIICCDTFGACKCCGKRFDYREYINAHYRAKYRGGIVPFHYFDNNPIL